MPSIRIKETKNGTPFYEIRVSTGRGKPQLSTRWYPPEGWSKRAIDKELASVAAEFERKCQTGDVLTKQQARERAAEEKAAADSILTLRKYCETVFMPAKTITMSENGRSSYQCNLDKWIYPALGDIKMPEVTNVQIAALLLDMQAQGKAHGTVIKVYTILSSLFKRAYMDDVVPANPIDKVERPKPRKDEKKKEVEAYTVDELRYILECLSRESLKWQAYVRLLVDTGIRRGECCAIRWGDLDFKENTLFIHSNLCYTAQKGVYEDTTKSSSVRRMDVDPDVMALLKAWRLEQTKQGISKYVFTKKGSLEPMHPQSPTQYMSRFAARNNIKELHPHKMRHTFASIAITHGADVASISEKLGHSDKAVTLRMYTHADSESIKRAGNVFRDAVKLPPAEQKNIG